MKNLTRIAMSALALGTLAGASMAQTISATAPGNARFVYGAGAVPTTNTDTDPGTPADLDINGAATGGDQLFATWWHYRAGGDVREFNYSAASNPFVAAGDTMTGSFSFNTFRSDLRYVISDPDGAGNNTALLQMYNRITNTGSVPNTVSIYNYADFDPNGDFSHPYSYDATRQALTGVNNNAGPIVNFFFKGFGADAYEASAFSALRTRLTDADVDNLTNTVTGGGGTGSDFTGAFQWNLSLNPGQSIEILSVLAINTEPVPAPGALAVAGLAGLVGLRRRR